MVTNIVHTMVLHTFASVASLWFGRFVRPLCSRPRLNQNPELQSILTRTSGRRGQGHGGNSDRVQAQLLSSRIICRVSASFKIDLAKVAMDLSVPAW